MSGLKKCHFHNTKDGNVSIGGNVLTQQFPLPLTHMLKSSVYFSIFLFSNGMHENVYI